MDSVFILILMENPMRVFTKIMKEKGMQYINGQVEINSLENTSKVNSKVKELTYSQVEIKEEVSGRMARKSNGWTDQASLENQA